MSTSLLSVQQCARRLGYADDTIRRFIKRGDLRASKVGRWRVAPADFDAFLASRVPDAAADASAGEGDDLSLPPTPDSPFV